MSAPAIVSAKKAAELAREMAALGLHDADLRIGYYAGSGRGGQKRNKTATAARVTHVPSGCQGWSQQSRSRVLNVFLAKRSLCEHYRRDVLGEPGRHAAQIAKRKKQKLRRKRRADAKDRGHV